MSLAVAIQMDPIDAIDIEADSTFVLALEGQARGHRLHHYLPGQLSLTAERPARNRAAAGGAAQGPAITSPWVRRRPSTSPPWTSS